jgi:hypothetical protein
MSKYMLCFGGVFTCLLGCLPSIYQTKNGAGDADRTRDLDVGNVPLYQLSYARPHPQSLAKSGDARKSATGSDQRTAMAMYGDAD